MNRKEFGQFLAQEFKLRFPNGYTAMQTSDNFGLKTLYFSLGMVGNLVDCPNRIRENDPMLHMFSIDFRDDQKIVSEIMSHNGLMVEPIEQYLAMSKVKTKFRKKTGNIEKQKKHFVKWFDSLEQIFSENKENIYNVKRYNEKYLITNENGVKPRKAMESLDDIINNDPYGLLGV